MILNSLLNIENATQERNYKYFSALGMLFVTVLLTANIIGEKPIQMGFLEVPSGLLVFPLTYLLGDALAEVYGFKKSRQVIFMALFANLFMALVCYLVITLPAPVAYPKTLAYEQVLGQTIRLMLVSVFTYLIGEFTNTYIVSYLKIKMQGRLFWLRGLCGSWVGEFVETMLFIPLGFYGVRTWEQIQEMMIFVYLFKITYAFLAMPLLNQFVLWLKKQEGVP
ncbi:MAG: queuosine precursor transporter [Gammaproteobacteria bacterium]